jgi:hypothetical protein
VNARAGYVVVTGGAKRVGAAIVRRLAVDGWPVVIHCNASKTEADALSAELNAGGARTTVAQCALDDLDAVGAFPSDLLGDTPWAGLVNNASVFESDDFATLTPGALERAMRINFHAPVLLTRALHRAATTRGFVVNILDQKTDNPNPDYLSYTFSKLALHAATGVLAQATAPKLRVNAVSPGLLLPSGPQTNFDQVHNRTLLGEGAAPEDVADAVAFLAGAERIDGAVLNVDAGQRLVASDRDVMFT